MRSSRRRLWVPAAMLLAVLWQGGGAARAAQATPKKLTKKELNSLIATAKTPQDHEKLAAYYRAQAAAAKAMVAEHEKMALEYEKNPASHMRMKSPEPLDYCRTLVRIYGDEARQYAALAAYHEKMAQQAAK